MRFRHWMFVLAALASTPVLAQNPDLPKLDHFDPNVVDKSLEPCDDFYKFVCSKWQASNPIPPDQPVWNTGSNLQLWNETILRDAMTLASDAAKQRDAVHQKVGDYWAACTDEAGIDKSGIDPIKADLSSIGALKSVKDLADAIYRIHNEVPAAWTGGNNQTPTVLFGFGPIQDFKKASQMVAGFDQAGMGLPGRDYYLSDSTKMQDTRKKYQQHLQNMFTLAGEPTAQAAKDAQVVLAMETQIAKAAMDVVKRRDPANINNPMSLAEVKRLAPSFDWDRYLKLTGAPVADHYIVTSPDYFRGMEQLLRSESLDNWKTYLRWWTLHTHAPYLSKAFVDENFDFYGRGLTGAEQLRPRWRRCVAYADRDLGEALGQAYVEKAFPPSSKQGVDDLVENIRSALGQDIQTLNWMSAATKQQAEEKLHGILNNIGYPDKWLDYSSVKIGRNDLVSNVHQSTAFEFHRQLSKIGKSVDRTEWQMTPPTINAYYDPQLNTINFPAGILQPPYFEPKISESANYGAIGMIIGHEISHGFDDQGRKFDAKGDLRDWWTPEDAKRYDEKAKCISDEYTADVPELGVKTNGLLTLGEDSADQAGMRISFLAFENAYQKTGKSIDEKDADGWTPRQKFFMSHAFSWCSNWRPDFERNIISTNPHSLDHFRVNNVESNSAEFWKAFNCKPGQHMVRENACRVW